MLRVRTPKSPKLPKYYHPAKFGKTIIDPNTNDAYLLNEEIGSSLDGFCHVYRASYSKYMAARVIIAILVNSMLFLANSFVQALYFQPPVQMDISSNKTLPDFSKLEPLDGNNFKRWSKKLLIFFEQLEVDYVLFDAPPVDVPNVVTDVSNSSATVVTDDAAKKKFEKDNKTVRGHLLNHMTNPLFDLFVTNKSAKEIWDSLEKKYGVDDAGKKKYVVGRWIKFQMVDNKPIMEQVHEYENLTAAVLTEGMKMCEVCQANVLLEKFPPSWSDYRNQLKHKKKDLTL
ncbi:uncharacterized protein LOC132613103 [Lycium barbarum]|uniref:uncharacterized protein LOC132613103 n=1 Tax=Lycium barbarum TaxID=112863 RepID=UPI00293E40C6|nr:uncharacterized protein LOC132613103 [Lycium barbarum]